MDNLACLMALIKALTKKWNTSWSIDKDNKDGYHICVDCDEYVPYEEQLINAKRYIHVWEHADTMDICITRAYMSLLEKMMEVDWDVYNEYKNENAATEFVIHL